MNEQERTRRKCSDSRAAFRRGLVICGLFGVAGILIGYSENGFWGAVAGGIGGPGAWLTFTDDIAPSLAKWRTLTRRQVTTRLARLAIGFVAFALGIAAIALGCFLLLGDNYVWATSILGTAWMIWIAWQTGRELRGAT